MGENNGGAWSVLLGLAAGLGVGAAVGYALGELGREDGERVAYGRGLAEGRRMGFNEGAEYGRTDAALFPSHDQRLRAEAERGRVAWQSYRDGHAHGREAERRDRGADGPSRETLVQGSMWRPR